MATGKERFIDLDDVQAAMTKPRDPTSGRKHWVCPDCKQACKCSPDLWDIPHVACGVKKQYQYD